MRNAGFARAAESLFRANGETLLRFEKTQKRCGLQVVIDNLDGGGARDYTDAVMADGAVRITRGLNVPSRCECDVLVAPGGLPLPSRRGRVVVKSEDGLTLFTGYLAIEPVRAYEGEGAEGRVYRAKLSAISDEWLLDKQGPAGERGDGLSLGLNARQVLESLTRRVGGAAFDVSDGGVSTQALGALRLADDASWSAQAGAAATAAYAAYRVVDGSIRVQPAGTNVHSVNVADGSLTLAGFETSQMRSLANDVTVSGEQEPTMYVTDVFYGDGIAAEFALTEPAYRHAQTALLQDSFATSVVDARQWSPDDPGAHLSITSAGLTINGGTGVDGATTLSALDAIEMGGSLLVELQGVRLAANSDGMLAGLYSGDAVLPSCFAGFRVRQSDGASVIVPVVSGAEIGTVFPVAADHSYTLRLRLHCAETQRVMQRYSTMVDGVVQTFGSASAVSAPMDVVFEVRDEGQGSVDPATVLYDTAAAGGAITLTPATCAFLAVNSTQLFGSVASVEVSRPGTLWVESTLSNGNKQTRLIGSLYQGVDCSASAGGALSGPGRVTFFPGRVPSAGEIIRVRYRTSGRSMARVADAASIATEAAAGAPGTSRWLGKVLQPPARSSADCESAAAAILAFSTSRSAAIAGTYVWVDPVDDVWTGDLLQVTSDAVTTPLLVRSVVIDDQHGRPAMLRYRIVFANDWATQLEDGLGLRLSESIANDAVLPMTPSNGTAVLANPGALQVVSVNGTAVTIDVGVDAPSGGGFEVRRRDGGFGLSDIDLVLRSPVRTFSIPRVAQAERYYVRMYDTSAPVKYSRFASAVFVDVPVG